MLRMVPGLFVLRKYYITFFCVVKLVLTNFLFFLAFFQKKPFMPEIMVHRAQKTPSGENGERIASFHRRATQWHAFWRAWHKKYAFSRGESFMLPQKSRKKKDKTSNNRLKTKKNVLIYGNADFKSVHSTSKSILHLLMEKGLP